MPAHGFGRLEKANTQKAEEDTLISTDDDKLEMSADKSSSSTSQLDFDRFLQELRSPECSSLVSRLKNFLSVMSSTQWTILQQRRLVLKFLNTIQSESTQNSVFAKISAERTKNVPSSAEYESNGAGDAEDETLTWIREGWEKLVMTKIYDQVFCPPNSEESKMAAYLAKQIHAFSWIQERHLDLPFTLESALEVAQAEILKVNGFKSPRDKLVIIQNTVQLAVDLIKNTTENAGSDHLLPVLILIIIRASPPNIIANIMYIMRFRDQQELEKGQNQYYLTSMMGAVYFIYNLSAKSLTIPPEDLITYNIPSLASVDQTPKPDLVPYSPSPISPTSENLSMPNALTQQQRGKPVLVSQPSHPDLNKVLANTTGFFNTLFKDVTATVDHFVDGVRGKSSNAPMAETAGQRQQFDDGLLSDNTRLSTDQGVEGSRTKDHGLGRGLSSYGGLMDMADSAPLSNMNATSSNSKAAVTKLRSFSEGIGRTFSSLINGDAGQQQAHASPTTTQKLSMGNQYIDVATRRALEKAERDFDSDAYYYNQLTPPLPSREPISRTSTLSGLYPGRAAYGPHDVYHEDQLGNSVNSFQKQFPLARQQVLHQEFHDPSLMNGLGLTPPERAEIEDYELQLALALSLSAQEAANCGMKEDIVNAVSDSWQDIGNTTSGTVASSPSNSMSDGGRDKVVASTVSETAVVQVDGRPHTLILSDNADTNAILESPSVKQHPQAITLSMNTTTSSGSGTTATIIENGNSGHDQSVTTQGLFTDADYVPSKQPSPVAVNEDLHRSA
ncbi:hypothetical protein SeMB42_g03551 [Synchytrium endobioticum]|uniref:VPS9 domain-containing protein n=1 Tax=Synchytrium endobioticum TaxID=286115 RepID=A0A507D5Q2_9FUNG|nr:hypothetical protein SeLEV6574_g04421 [Synchytrium endobioticum]TPX46832.1 hypothetical protein SeMB42_g03551 [Synchytrium endobioticum]